MSENHLLSSTASKLLTQADAKAERLLGIVRMVIAGSIAVALVIALNAPGRPESEFLERQGAFAAIGMASYFFVGLAAYLLVTTGKYKPWMAWVTAFFDATLIATNVWLSINFSGLNSHYALVFPSALMIPLILTFGALRFRPDIQLSMTVFVCLLTVAIIFSNPFFEVSNETIISQMNLTHALPPNMIRIWLIFSTGAVVAVAVWRARGLLYRITEETEQRLNLTRFLPATVLDNLTDKAMNDLRNGREAFVVIMFLDVRGFTKMSEKIGIEKTSRFLTSFRSMIIDACEKHGGVVDKFIGDGALVIFGISTTPEEGAKSAINAATQLNKQFEHWHKNDADGFEVINVGIGLHAGEAFLGIVGDERRVEFTVIGDNVNIASRIEQLTKTEPYSLLATHQVMQLLSEHDANWQNIGNRPIRGHEQGANVWAYSSNVTARL